MESIFFIFFFTIFFIVIGTFIYTIVAGIGQWHRNNNSPRLSVDATVVAKRAHVSNHRHNHNGHTHTSHSTTYYVTFQVASGDRMELHVPATEYGLLVEGDSGVLSFQGTRYLGFERAM